MFSLSKIIIILVLAFAFNSSVFAQSCLQLFRDNAGVTTVHTPEQRKLDAPLVYTPPAVKPFHISRTVNSSFLAPGMRILFTRNNRQYRAYSETIVTVNGVPKVKRDELPMDRDLPFMVNANLSTGRAPYRAALAYGHGVVITLDANNVGWINKNFADRQAAGDQFLRSVNDVIYDVAHRHGLFFRLGGDEFGIILPMLSPKEINQILREVDKTIQQYAYEQFSKEKDFRWNSMREAEKQRNYALEFPHQFTPEQIDSFKNAFLQARAHFQELVFYIRPSVSVGAAYLGGGRTADAVQAEADNNGVSHKIALKWAAHRFDDIKKKYQAQGVDLNFPILPIQVVKYDFPILPDQTHTQPQWRPTKFDYPVVTWSRLKVIHRIGHYRIAEFKPEHGDNVLKVEIYQDGVLQDLVDLPLHDHTQLIDFQSGIAQRINTDIERAKSHKALSIDLLNLGKLNYFLLRSKTGDLALARVSVILRNLMKEHDIGFKLRGSEFLIYIHESQNLNLFVLKANHLLNNDPVLKQFYEDQINHLIKEGEPKSVIDEIRRLMNGPMVKIEGR